jgi:predicted LPLAT superfamily acyltransferase
MTSVVCNKEDGKTHFSNMDIAFDRQEQLQQIQSGLLPGEQVIAVYDAIGAGTGFLGLTDRRVIVQDKSFVGKKVAITSIPYAKISAVSVVSNKSFAGSFFSSGAIAIHVGTHTYEVEFRGENKAHHVHNVILHYIAR